MFTHCSSTDKAGSKGARAKSLVWRTRVLFYNKWLHLTTPTTSSKLGRLCGNPGKLPKVGGDCGTQQGLRDWGQCKRSACPFWEQSPSYLWQTISCPLATNQSSLWALLLPSKVFGAHSRLSPWNLIRAGGLVILTHLSHLSLRKLFPVLYRSIWILWDLDTLDTLLKNDTI